MTTPKRAPTIREILVARLHRTIDRRLGRETPPDELAIADFPVEKASQERPLPR